MRTTGLPIGFGMMFIVMAVLTSCAASKRQDGFSYVPKYAGPDVEIGGGRLEEREQVEGGRLEEREQVEGGRLEERENEVIKELVETGISVQAEQTSTPVFKTTVRKMAQEYGEKRQIRYSEKQLKQLDRIAVKLEKQQLRKKGPDVTWGPSNNLEWAILGAAAVGLFVGIFGIGFGWAIFLLAALAYLYFKLLHNN